MARSRELFLRVHASTPCSVEKAADVTAEFWRKSQSLLRWRSFIRTSPQPVPSNRCQQKGGSLCLRQNKILFPLPPTLTLFMLVKTTSEFLALTTTARDQFLKTTAAPILSKYSDSVRLALYDTEFYSARLTDI
jgi:hypothetical protein